MVTVPSSPMATNARGSSTQPSGIPSRPYFGGSAARRGEQDGRGRAEAAGGPPRLAPRRWPPLPHWAPADRLDGGDLSLRRSRDRRDAGARGSAIEVDGTGAAQRHAATELGPGHSEDIAQHPQKRRLRRHVHLLRFAIHVKRYHVTLPGSETSWTSVEPEFNSARGRSRAINALSHKAGSIRPRYCARDHKAVKGRTDRSRSSRSASSSTYSVPVTVASNGAALMSISPPL